MREESQGEAPYALGLRSFHREMDVSNLSVEGVLPTWLQGTLIRNGPARFEVGDQPYNHWFDGTAMLHAFTFAGGKVSYRNRFLRSRSFEEGEAAGRIRRAEFATDPCYTLFGRVMAVFRPPITDNANVNVHRIGGQMAALTETPLPIRFDPETLETLGVLDWADDLKGTVTTAHPHEDPETGALYSYMAHFGRRHQYHLVRVEPGSTTRHRVASMPVDRPAYMHSFAMTTRHLVLVEYPLVVNPVDLLTSGVPFIRNYRWQPERGTRFQVFDRDSGAHLGTWKTEACFAFHQLNAFVEGDDLVVDLTGYDDAHIIDQLYLEPLRRGATEGVRAMPWRFRLALSDSSRPVQRTVLAAQNIELPRIDEALNGRPYRFVWGVANQVPGHFTDALVKLDVTTGESIVWHRDGCFPGEPVFLPRPHGRTGEDDGILLSVVLEPGAGAAAPAGGGNAAPGRSWLAVLNAATMALEAKVSLPHAIPLGFHGAFLGQDQGGG
jgi:beta,beta-carotene 9',10'-dioxygenase